VSKLPEPDFFPELQKKFSFSEWGIPEKLPYLGLSETKIPGIFVFTATFFSKKTR